MIKNLRYKKWKKIIQESGLFDAKYYLFAYPDVRHRDVDPLMHYIKYGAKEGRNPSKEFDTKFYLNNNKDVNIDNLNPLVHYILYGKKENRVSCSVSESSVVVNNILSTKNKDEFVEYKKHQPLGTKLKTVAFYLPQFHPFPENDRWWGKGFTEWTNVTKAKPNFVGHYQPHLPIHNGFYDLRIPEVMIEQAKLARNYGIYGFNFYYYWFDGKILMHKPFEILLKHKEIDINFCITWANENWTRRWDGLENEVLIAQNHSEDDSIKFIESLYKYFEDERYIRVNNKPVLIIYRSSIIPKIKKMGEIWRKEAIKAGFDGLYLVCAQTTGTYNPNNIGFDAAMEFPPHTTHNEKYSKELQIMNPNFQGTVFDYDIAAKKALEKQEPSFKLFKTSTLSWDNTARRQDNATIFHNFSIEAYKNWMNHLYKTTLNNDKYNDDEKLVFVNAWNEWAEGTHLEPDSKYGYAYLEATYEVLKSTCEKRNKILVVSHDAYPHGAQFLAFNIIKTLKEIFFYEVEVILCGKGNLTNEFEKICKVHHIYNLNGIEQNKLFFELNQRGYKKAIANTSVVGNVVEALANENIKLISLVHEMSQVIKDRNLFLSLSKIYSYSEKVIFPTKTVKNDIKNIFEINENLTRIIPQGLFRKNKYKYNKVEARKKLCNELKIPIDSKIVVNIAYGDYRKGIDIFSELGSKVIEESKKIHFVWVGHFELSLMENIKKKLTELNKSNIHFIGFQSDIDHYYAGSDLFFLTSREDPFPSVVLDAMNCALPVIAFKNCGGFEEIIEDKDLLLDINNIDFSVKFLIDFLNHDRAKEIGEKNQKLIDTKFSFNNYIYNLLDLLGEKIKKVSVIVPSYNHEKYIKERLESILNQSYPIYEIIYLDDNSNDTSLDLAKKILADSNIDFQIIKNETNSGSVFKQWIKGINLSKGDFIWIAESDDACEKDFLKKLINNFSNEDIGISYCQSKIIDQNSVINYSDVMFHTDSIDTQKWKNSYIEKGAIEVRKALVYKNTIPNVSACLFRKKVFDKVDINKLSEFRFCGDWYLYALILEQFDISFLKEPLNNFRKHSSNVTTTNSNKIEYIDEIIKIKEYLHNHFFFTDEEIEKINKDFVLTYIEHNIHKNQILEKYRNKLKDFCVPKSKNMTIVTFNQEFGGSEVLWYELSQALSLRGHSVNVFCLKELLNTKRKENLLSCGVKLNEVNSIDLSISKNMASDLIIFSTGDHNAGGALFEYCFKNSLKYIIINQLVKESMWANDEKFLQTLFDGYKNAYKAFFTSLNNIKIFESKMGEKLINAEIHYNPIDIDRDDYVKYSIVKDNYHVAFPARLLTIHKGQDLLLEVLSQKKWKERNLVINFYGTGPDEEKLKDMVRKKDITNVNFLGHVESMRKIWEENHAFILTSHMEGLPIVLLSAMFAGRVPIVTNVGGNSEVILNGENGFVSKDVSVKSIDEVLEKAWSKRDKWKKLGEKAKSYIASKYPTNSMEDMSNKIIYQMEKR